jgi:hypothetical protein
MQATLVAAAASGIAALALFVATQRRLGTLKPNLFCAQVTFTERQFRAVIEQWGSEGLTRFRSHFALDYCFLACYGLFGFALGSYLQSGSMAAPFYRSALPWVLPAAAFFDAIENICHQRFLVAAPYSLPKFAFIVAGMSSSAKWLLSLVFLFLAAFAAMC